MSKTNPTETPNSRNIEEDTKYHIYKPPVRTISNKKVAKQIQLNEAINMKEIKDFNVEEQDLNKHSLKPIIFYQPDTQIKTSPRTFGFEEMKGQLDNKKTSLIFGDKRELELGPLLSRNEKRQPIFNYSFINMGTHTTSDSKDLNMTTSTLSTGTFKNFSFIEKCNEDTAVRNQDLLTSFIENDVESTVNLEDLMLLEEKLSDIITDLNNKADSTHQCYEWWNLFFNCSLYGKFQDYVKDEKQKLVVKEYENLKLIAVMLCYELSNKAQMTLHTLLKSTIDIVHRNYLILCEYIISKVSSESLKNIWVIRLNKLLTHKQTAKLTRGQHIPELMVGNQSLIDYINVIIKNIPDNVKRDTLAGFIKNITLICTVNLNDFFQRKIFKVVNRKSSEIASVVLDSGYKQKQVPFPYINKEAQKDYTLVLDLDETLIHFKADRDGKTGTIKLRPGLYDFLDSMRKHYEIIIFTASTQEVNFN
jgi:hypothetical protein